MNTAFQETQHPRAATGVFVEKRQRAAEISLSGFLDTPKRRRHLTDFAGLAAVEQTIPYDASQVAGALDARDDTNSSVRLVNISRDMATMDDAVIYGPEEDGKPLLVDISTGAGIMTVKSGFVVIRCDSNFPQDITIEGNAEVSVILARGRHAVIRAKDEAAVFVFAEEGARGILRMDSANAFGEVAGETSGFHVVDAHEWPAHIK